MTCPYKKARRREGTGERPLLGSAMHRDTNAGHYVTDLDFLEYTKNGTPLFAYDEKYTTNPPNLSDLPNPVNAQKVLCDKLKIPFFILWFPRDVTEDQCFFIPVNGFSKAIIMAYERDGLTSNIEIVSVGGCWSLRITEPLIRKYKDIIESGERPNWIAAKLTEADLCPRIFNTVIKNLREYSYSLAMKLKIT